MRYYSIKITNPSDGSLISAPGFAGLLGNSSYTSFVNGQTLPGALNVEIDCPIIDAATSQGFALLRIWGISLAEIAQANNLINKNITVFAGMQRGLPLANPAQSGQITSGFIYQCFGNWIGTDMTLDFVISPGSASGTNPGGIGTLAAPKNFTLNWQGGAPLGPALQNCLQTAFPGYTVNVNINSGIVRPSGDSPVGFYSTLEQLAQDVRTMSKSIIKTTGYAGVRIVLYGTTINVADSASSSTSSSSSASSSTSSSSSSNSTAIAFQDLIGQPTWIESPNIQLKTVMRADLKIWSKITLPQTLIQNTSQANSNIVNQKVNFQGGFYVVSLRHVGNFRQPSADAWVSIIEAAPQNPS